MNITRSGDFLYYMCSSDEFIEPYTEVYHIMQYCTSSTSGTPSYNSFNCSIQYYTTEGAFNVYTPFHYMDIIL